METTIDDVLGTTHRWYHTIELAPGVTTSGWIDLRDMVARCYLPDDLSGKRALDVGTFDGFWAFELEKRGAEVIAIDVDSIPPPDGAELHRARIISEVGEDTPGTGFRLLKNYFRSSVDRVSLNVYDLSPGAIGGSVDIVFLGALLPHLRNPVAALERINATLAPDGMLVMLETVEGSLLKSKEPVARFIAHESPWTWWVASPACLLKWVATAQFQDIRVMSKNKVKDMHGFQHHFWGIHARPSTWSSSPVVQIPPQGG